MNNNKTLFALMPLDPQNRNVQIHLMDKNKKPSPNTKIDRFKSMQVNFIAIQSAFILLILSIAGYFLYNPFASIEFLKNLNDNEKIIVYLTLILLTLLTLFIILILPHIINLYKVYKEYDDNTRDEIEEASEDLKLLNFIDNAFNRNEIKKEFEFMFSNLIDDERKIFDYMTSFDTNSESILGIFNTEYSYNHLIYKLRFARDCFDFHMEEKTRELDQINETPFMHEPRNNEFENKLTQFFNNQFLLEFCKIESSDWQIRQINYIFNEIFYTEHDRNLFIKLMMINDHSTFWNFSRNRLKEHLSKAYSYFNHYRDIDGNDERQKIEVKNEDNISTKLVKFFNNDDVIKFCDLKKILPTSTAVKNNSTKKTLSLKKRNPTNKKTQNEIDLDFIHNITKKVDYERRESLIYPLRDLVNESDNELIKEAFNKEFINRFFIRYKINYSDSDSIWEDAKEIEIINVVAQMRNPESLLCNKHLLIVFNKFIDSLIAKYDRLSDLRLDDICIIDTEINSNFEKKLQQSFYDQKNRVSSISSDSEIEFSKNIKNSLLINSINKYADNVSYPKYIQHHTNELLFNVDIIDDFASIYKKENIYFYNSLVSFIIESISDVSARIK